MFLRAVAVAIVLFQIATAITETDLRLQLLSRYSRDSLPEKNDGRSAVTVNVGLAVRALAKMSQLDGHFILNVWLRQKWYDERLSWNTTQYELENESVPLELGFPTDPSIPGSIWTPDFYCYNTAEKPFDQLVNSGATVYPDGLVIWSRPGLITASCDYQLKHFPYDVQHCELKIGSWKYSAGMLNVQVGPNGFSPVVDFGVYAEHEEWELYPEFKSAEAILNNPVVPTSRGTSDDSAVHIEELMYACCPDPYQTVHFKFTARRLPGFYEQVFLIPAFTITFAMLFAIFIPSSAGERIGYVTTMMLTLIVFLQIVAQYLPRTSETPSFTKLLNGTFYFASAFLVFTICATKLQVYRQEVRQAQDARDSKQSLADLISQTRSSVPLSACDSVRSDCILDGIDPKDEDESSHTKADEGERRSSGQDCLRHERPLACDTVVVA